LTVISPSGAVEQSSSQPSRSAFPAYVTQSGQPDGSAAAIVPAGTDVLLSQALHQVLPAGFTLVDNQIPMRKLASWTGPRPWLDVLADLGRAASFVAHVDWSTHEVSLAPVPSSLANRDPSQVSVLPSAVKEIREIREVQVVDQGLARSTPVAIARPSAPPAPVVQNWALDSSLTLRENVESWAKKAGWTVVWDAVDYPVFAQASFTGDFTAENGPLAQLFAGYANSDQPLLVRLTSRDRVVYVRNRVLDRADVSPLPSPVPAGTF
jgi:type IV pili sensor histidine kinase/response regulator